VGASVNTCGADFPQVWTPAKPGFSVEGGYWERGPYDLGLDFDCRHRGGIRMFPLERDPFGTAGGNGFGEETLLKKRDNCKRQNCSTDGRRWRKVVGQTE